MTPLVAGVRLIPYIFTASIGSLVANIVAVKAKIPPIHLLFFGTVLQVLGLVLLSTLPVAEKFPTEGYGYEVLAGIGVGVTFGILILTTPFVADAKDLGQ